MNQQFSPDGHWWWNGSEWLPADQAPPEARKPPEASPPVGQDAHGQAPWHAPFTRSRHRNLWIVAGVAVLVVMIIVAAIGSSSAPGSNRISSSTVTPTPTPPSTPRPASVSTPVPAPAQHSIYHVGDQVEVYSDDRSTDLLVTVNKVDTAKSNNPYITPPPGGIFLTVDTTIENKSTQTFNASSLNFEVRDETGQSYNSTSLPDLPQPPSGQVAPSDKVRGVQAFGVPAGHTFRLYFQALLFTNGQTIFDLGPH